MLKIGNIGLAGPKEKSAVMAITGTTMAKAAGTDTTNTMEMARTKAVAGMADGGRRRACLLFWRGSLTLCCCL